MKKNQALLFFLTALCVLILFSWVLSGSILPTGNDAIWFHSGLFTLLLGKFITEYKFTKPNDVFVNSCVVFASVSILQDPPLEFWWNLVRWGALGLGIGAFIISWDTRLLGRRGESSMRKFWYRLITNTGKAEVLFSAVFVLSVLSYFNPESSVTKSLVIFWGLILALSAIQLGDILQPFFRGRHEEAILPFGHLHSVHSPSILIAHAIEDDHPAIHEIVRISHGKESESHSYGMTVSKRSSLSTTLVLISLIDEDTSIFDSLNDVEMSKLPPDSNFDELGIPKEYITSPQDVFVGTVAPRTDITTLEFEIFGTPDLEAGTLLTVTSKGRKIFFQIVDAAVAEESTHENSIRNFTVGKAEQVGHWSPSKKGFEAYNWVSNGRALVRTSNDTPDHEVLSDTEAILGHIPNSKFPIVIDINEWVLYHTAVLGVTGSGKSFLTYQAIDEAAKSGIKSVCIDPTGEYQKYLPQAVSLISQEHVDAFLSSDEHMVGIIETAAGAHRRDHPIKVANDMSQRCLDWCKRNRTNEEILTPRAKVQIVFEEAHLLVPEWNFNPDRNLQSLVSQTAQIVLQARKYGLGFLIVSQRTANVVKSILNQCNTIASFQAFDETGFDFMSNYMGRSYVRALPNLLPRQGVIVGKASKSSRPVIVKFLDQNREIRTNDPVIMPLDNEGDNEVLDDGPQARGFD